MQPDDDRISASALSALLPEKTLEQSLFIFDSLPSTNSFALDLVQHHPPHGTLIIADHQSSGRGRLDRKWFSPSRANIYGSLILRSRKFIPEITRVPLMAGLAISQILERYSIHPVRLKWPNDILIQGKKVGGVLCETAGLGTNDQAIILGFGINVNLEVDHFPPDLQKTATSLRITCGRKVDRHTLIAEMVQILETRYLHTSNSASHQWKKEYEEKCETIGQMIQANLPGGRSIEGKAVGIGAEGQLQILTEQNHGNKDLTTLQITSGDIVHLRQTN